MTGVIPSPALPKYHRNVDEDAWIDWYEEMQEFQRRKLEKKEEAKEDSREKAKRKRKLAGGSEVTESPSPTKKRSQ